jgi:hypothetical protein
MKRKKTKQPRKSMPDVPSQSSGLQTRNDVDSTLTVELPVAGFIIKVDSVALKPQGAARIFTLQRIRGASMVFVNRPAMLAKAFREMAKWLDTFPGGDQL